MIELLNTDAVYFMSKYPDKYFDLAIIDPPYGIGMGNGAGETRGVLGKKKKDLYTPKDWDNKKPDEEFWLQLFDVSKNQIVFGGNYFTSHLPESRGWIYWRKQMGGNYSDGELAWTSFDVPLKEFTKRPQQGSRIHPTQKPVALYRWLLHNYAKPGDKVLDTHLGSGSSAIAAHQMGFDFVGCEIDLDYYNAACKRFKEQTMQGSLFKP